MYDKYGDSYIICTIYEPVEGNAMLYSKIGVAQPYYNENGDYATPKSIDGHKEWWKWLGVPFGFSAPSRLWYLDFSDRSEKTSKVLTLDEILDTSDKNNYRVVDRNETKSFQGTRESGESQSDLSARAFAYKVPQYHQFTLDEEDAKETWFQFVYLYESAELGGTDHRPESGSIFNVTGITTDNVDRAIYPKESGLKYWRILGAVIEILGTIAVGGIGGAISKAAGKIVAKTFIKRAAVALVKGIATAAFAGALKLGSMAFDQFASIQKQAAVYSSVQDQTIGFLGESYQRQVLYRNGIMDDNIDSTWTNEDGVLYAYVGTVRPSDYYKNKYFVYYVENADITENATDFKTETVGDLEVGKKVTNGTFKGAYECTYNEHKAYCYDYFAYHNNSYYIVMDALAGNLRYIPDQPYFDFNENSANQPNLDYIQNNGLIYVRGTFKDGSYTMQETNTWNNHWYGSNNEDAKRKTKDDDGNETTLSWQSGNGQFAVSQPLEYVAVHTGNIDGSYISNSNNRDNDFYKDGETIKEYSKDGDLSKVYYNGYGYMNGIYYTARVKAIQSMDANGDIKDIPAKIGKFTYNGTDEPEGTLNVDYIKVNIKTTSDGSTSYEPGYYIFDSADNINIYKLNDSLDQQAQELYVNMYPDSFVNPYKESTTNTKDTDYYYILKEAVGDFNGITYAPTYFYFDGGYETNSDGLVFTELQSTFTYSYTEDGKTKTVEVDLYDSKENLQKATDDLKLSEDDDTIDGISKIFMLTIYNGETPVTVTYKKFIDNYENIYSGDDYYILPIDLNRSDIGGMDIYKVKNNYIIDKNNHICELDSNYMVYQTTGDNDSNAYLNGMICYTKLQIPNAGGSTNSWNFNKYCVDAEKGIYARYSYANLNSGTEFRTGDNKTYLLYNNGFNRPNGGGTTYFVEGVRVILGGGGEYQNLYEGNNLDPGNDIGSITCE